MYTNTYFSNRKKYSLAEQFNDDMWITKLAFLSDIFEPLNELNVEMQEIIFR